MANRVYDPEDTEKELEKLRHATGISEREEKAMEDAAYSGAAEDIAEREGLDDKSGKPTRADKKESAELAKATGSKETVDETEEYGGGKSFFRSKDGGGNSFWSRRRKTAAVLGISGIGGVLGLGFGLMTLLSPYKAAILVQKIEDKVGQVPQGAVEKRVDYLLNTYLINRTIAKELGESVADRGAREYIYTSSNLVDTLYTNWKGAKIEAQLEGKYGIRLAPKARTSDINSNLFARQFTQPSDWTIEVLDGNKAGRLADLAGDGLDSIQARSFLREFARESTKNHQIIKRLHIRMVMKKYFGVPKWKLFERTRTAAKASYLEKKVKLKKYIIQQTVGRVSARYGLYFGCILDGGGQKCEDLRKGSNPDADPNLPNPGDTADDAAIRADAEANTNRASGLASSDMGTLADDAADAAGDLMEKQGAVDTALDKLLSNEIVRTIQEIGLKKVLTYFSAGIGIVSLLSHIDKALENGSLSLALYDKYTQQYAAFAAPIMSTSHQVLSGDDFDPEDPNLVQEILVGGESSPTYQTLINDTANGQFQRDCDNDGQMDTLRPGETVCPDKKALQDREAFIRDNPVWQTIREVVIKPFNSTIGIIVNKITDVANWVTGFLHINDALTYIMDQLGITAALSKGIEVVMNMILGSAVTGAEVGPAAFDALYAGIQTANSSLGGAVGATRENTIGGAYMTPQQAAEAKAEYAMLDRASQPYQSVHERYFALDNPNSLLANTVMEMPGSTGEAFASVRGFFGSLMNPSKLFGMISRPALAQAQGVPLNQSPFGILDFGYAANDPIFTMSPKQLETTYQCDLAPADRPANKSLAKPAGIPFKVFTQADGCLLEQTAVLAGRGLFTGEADSLVDGTVPGGGSAAVSSKNVFIIGDSLTAGMQSLGGTYAQKTYLADQLRAVQPRPWNPTVNAQGCRGVYQPGGPIAGDGRACPRETIVDAFTVINDPANLSALQSSGLVVVALGTNATEGDAAAFKTQALRLVSEIRQKPGLTNVAIAWVNLSIPAAVDRATSRNQVLDEIAAQTAGFVVIDWNAYVQQVNTDADSGDDVTFADGVHHTADGYRKKVAFLVASLSDIAEGGQ